MVLTVIALVLPLGLDTFAVAAALGALGDSERAPRRIALWFAACEGAMPLVGLAAGAPLGRTLGHAADFVAIAVLLALGLSALRGDDDDERIARVSGGGRWGMVLLGLAISLDELAIGFTFGLLRVPVIPVIVLIAAQAAIVTRAGLALGARLGEAVRERAERLAGAVLVALAAALLAVRLAG